MSEYEDDWCVLTDGGEEINEEIENTEDPANQEGQPPEETLEETVARLKAENEEHVKNLGVVNNEKSQMGRRVKELQEYQKTNDATVQSLQQAMNNINQPKDDGTGYIDMNDPAVAEKWFQDQANKLMTSQNNAQTQYEQSYEKYVSDLMLENESLSPEEKSAIMKTLETQKDNMFNDPRRDAQYNINIAKGKYYEGIAKDGGIKNPHIKTEKPVGTGVGGTGTKPIATTKVTDTPAEKRIKDQFAAYKAERGY